MLFQGVRREGRAMYTCFPLKLDLWLKNMWSEETDEGSNCPTFENGVLDGKGK